jgi:formylmethanofuran dehydrogenase subunit E
MEELKDYFETALKFHGHKCPAMPMGLRASLAAMKALGVERAKDKELVVESETGEGHAAGCFVDGVMTATGGCSASPVRKGRDKGWPKIFEIFPHTFLSPPKRGKV